MTQTPTLTFKPLIVGAMRLGEWGVNMSTSELARFIEACLELDLTDFDHADIYGDYSTEGQFGAVLTSRPDLARQVEITTKCGIRMVSKRRAAHQVKSYDSSARHIIQSAEQALKRLGVEQIKLFLLHRPDYLLDPHEVAVAVAKLKSEGKILHFGVSNYTVSQIEKLNQFVPVENNQIEFSLTQLSPLDDGVLDQAWHNKIALTAWSPLGGGSMFTANTSEQISRIIKTSKAISLRYDTSFENILLAWIRKHPRNIIPVLGTAKIERIRAYHESLNCQITNEEWYELLEASRGFEVA